LGLVEKLEKEKFDRTAHRKKTAKRSIARANQPSYRTRTNSPKQLSQARIKGGGTLARARHAKTKGGAQLLKILNSSGVRKLRCPVSNNRTRSSPNL